MISSLITIDAIKRQQVLKMLHEYCSNVDTVREIESGIHCMSQHESEYIDKAQQILFNVYQNPKLTQHGINLLIKTDEFMARNTIIEDIQHETIIRQSRFEQMLQEKYDMVNDKSYHTTLKCRRCGSPEVSWEQKQTRSADEASTVFCTCTKCNNRWTMR